MKEQEQEEECVVVSHVCFLKFKKTLKKTAAFHRRNCWEVGKLEIEVSLPYSVCVCVCVCVRRERNDAQLNSESFVRNGYI